MELTLSRSSSSSSPSTNVSRVGTVFDVAILDDRPGILTFEATGENAIKLFENEGGGHRWQRIPPSEKKGRRHTSTITVAVMGSAEASESVEICEKDIEWQFCRGSGKGGQHRNTSDTAVWLIHKPTGIRVWSEDSRSQVTNRENAMKKLAKILKKGENRRQHREQNTSRKEQIGTGMRGDKIRTVRVHDNRVTNHLNGKKTSFTFYQAGDFSKLF